MVNKTTFKQYLQEAEEKMPRAEDVDDLLASIVDGKFTKDGSKLKVTGDFDDFDFDCSNNKLESLAGCPQTVVGDFGCYENNLKSLKGCPQTVGGGFYCGSNNLESLKDCPQTVGGDFWCGNNQLKSLVGCPQIVKGSFDCNDNQLKSLEGCPQIVSGYGNFGGYGMTDGFSCIKNKELTSLARINFYVHEINGEDGADFTGCPIKSNVLGLLKIRGLKKVAFDDKKLEAIINKYLPMGDSTDCIDDLLDAGYSKEYCKW